MPKTKAVEISDYVDNRSLSLASSVCRTWRRLLLQPARKHVATRMFRFTPLSEGATKLLIQDEDFIKCLRDSDFKKLIVSSDFATKTALETPFVVERLNKTSAGHQVFTSSCAARVLMKIQLEYKLISPEEYTNRRELEIFQQIWGAPGEGASPEKLSAYFKSSGLEYTPIEIKELAAKTCRKNVSARDLYQLFHRTSPVIQLPKASIDESLLQPGDTCLLVTGPYPGRANPMHAIFARRTTASNSIETWNPEHSVTRLEYFDTLTDLAERYEDFSGIGYIVKRPTRALTHTIPAEEKISPAKKSP